MSNIYPIFHKILSKSEKENLLKQKGIVIWMVGLSSSGKSTLARAFEEDLYHKGFITKLLDGDNLRSGVNNNLGFSIEDRTENVRRAAEVAKLFAQAGIVTICSMISPTEKVRSIAKEIIGEDFHEVYICCPFEVCAERDVKGLYKKALNGEIKNFTGLDSPFEEPKSPFITINTDQEELEVSKQKLMKVILPLITKHEQ